MMRVCLIIYKSYSSAGNLKVHIHTIHAGCKDYKCQSKKITYVNIILLRSTLNKHIRTVHKGHKDHVDLVVKHFTFSRYSVKIHIHKIHQGKKSKLISIKI